MSDNNTPMNLAHPSAIVIRSALGWATAALFGTTGILLLQIPGYPNIDSAVNAIKEGASDYVNKPFHMEDIRIKVDRIVDTKKAKKSLKKMTGFFWAVIISIPIWLILGIILEIIWNK